MKTEEMRIIDGVPVSYSDLLSAHEKLRKENHIFRKSITGMINYLDRGAGALKQLIDEIDEA